jgi:hypothetical protein
LGRCSNRDTFLIDGALFVQLELVFFVLEQLAFLAKVEFGLLRSEEFGIAIR